MTLKEEPIPNPIELSLDGIKLKVSYKYSGKGANVPYEFKIDNKDEKTWKVENDPKTPNIVFIQNANCKFRLNKIDPSDLSFATLKN